MFARFNLFLGHGRALETFFALVLLTWGCQILWSPEALKQSIALRDYYWTIPNHYIGMIVLGCGAISTLGIILNVSGIKFARYFRMIAALISMAIWLFLLSNLFQESGGYGGSAPWYFWAIPANARLFYLGLLNLPKPGAPGQFIAWPPIPPAP